MKHEVCGFEHLHLHTDYSLLDGYGRVEEYAKRAPEINQQFLCVTDHGMMGVVPRQITACEKNKLNPIFGCELFLNPYQIPLETDEERKKHKASLNEDEKILYRKSNHLLALALNDTGYKNLVRMTTWGYLYGWGGTPSRPRINLDILEKHKEGILFTSCCYASQIGFAFDTKGPDAAEDMVVKYKNLFGENFRLEIMMLDFEKQRDYDRFIIKMHAKYGIPVMLSQDCHYCKREDSRMQQKMLMIQTGKTIAQVEQGAAEGHDMFELQDTQLWMKSEDELNEMWETSYHDVIPYELFKIAKAETVKVANLAKGVKLNRDLKLPRLADADERLKEEIKKGVKMRGLKADKVYMSRIAEEYELITRKGFSSYFIIEKMFTDIARIKGPEILGYGDPEDMVGPGRGSAVGALTSYLLGITDVDPLPHDLLFSRFISEDRGRKMKYKMDGVQPLTEAA
jgi:DNA polymerase-3 subunit alpha